MSSLKKRSYNQSFLEFGFTFIVRGETQIPQCVICQKTLANESMKPGKLREHLVKVHPDLVSKDVDFFRAKESKVKKARLDQGSKFVFQNSSVVEASYNISLLIAKNRKPHTIGETLVKPCMVEAARLVLNQESVSKLKQVHVHSIAKISHTMQP